MADKPGTNWLDKAEGVLQGFHGQDNPSVHEALLYIIEEIKALRKEIEESRVDDAPGYDEIVDKDLTP